VRRLAFSLAIALAVGLLVSVPPLGPRSGGQLSFEVQRGTVDLPLAALVEAWRARLDGSDVAATERDGGVILVEVSGASADEADGIADALTRTGQLAFVEVLESTPAALNTFRALREADPGPVGVDVDSWRHEDSGRTFDDYYVYGPSVEAIAARLDALWDQDESTWLEEGQAIVFERVVPRAARDEDDDGEAASSPFVRTYIVDDRPWLSGDDVADAAVSWDPQTNRPEVLLTFTAEGARQFGELTSQRLGRKLAIVIDGMVVSAPVIEGRSPADVPPSPWAAAPLPTSSARPRRSCARGARARSCPTA
jgi:preprotein translocase subunit SecD